MQPSFCARPFAEKKASANTSTNKAVSRLMDIRFHCLLVRVFAESSLPCGHYYGTNVSDSPSAKRWRQVRGGKDCVTYGPLGGTWQQAQRHPQRSSPRDCRRSARSSPSESGCLREVSACARLHRATSTVPTCQHVSRALRGTHQGRSFVSPSLERGRR